jgi:hypothetical protein
MDTKLKYALKQGIITGLLYGLGISWWYGDPNRGLLTGIPFTVAMTGIFWLQKRSEEKKQEEKKGKE